jgi:hypothetical protein
MPSISNSVPQDGPARYHHLPHGPSREICDQVNAQVRSSQELNAASFDYALHVASRSYTFRTLDYGPFEFLGTAFLDKAVASLLPPAFMEVTRPAPGYGSSLAEKCTKGLGVFATRLFRRGETIMVEQPIVVVPFVVGLPAPHHTIYEDLVKRLHPEARYQILDLHQPRSGSPPQDERMGARVETIIAANAIGIKLKVPKNLYQEENGELETHRGVFLHGSRLNHRSVIHSEI